MLARCRERGKRMRATASLPSWLSVSRARLTTMTTQYYTASSIDGFIADPDNSLEWLFQFSDPSGMEDQYPKFIAQVGAIAMGSTTYEWIADYIGSRVQTSDSSQAMSRRFTKKWYGPPRAAMSG